MDFKANGFGCTKKVYHKAHLCLALGLLTDPQLFDDSTITLDVFCLQVI